MNKRIFTGIFVASIVILGLGVYSSGSIGNHAVISHKPKQDKVMSMAHNPVTDMNAYAANHLHGNNASSILEEKFLNWYSMHTGEQYGAVNVSAMAFHRDFCQFLTSDQGSMALLKEQTNRERIQFQKENRNAGMKFLIQLQNNHENHIIYRETAHNATSVLVPISDLNLPGYFPTSQGSWVMVSANYFSIPWWFPGPWWAPWEGHWGNLNYGEHDTINLMFVGNNAQNWYNHMYNTIGEVQTYSEVAAGVLSGASFLGSYYGIVALTQADVVAFIGIISVSLIAVGFITSHIQNQLHAMYDSTYANPQNGNPKLLWEFYDVNFYYPWITVVGTFASSFTWNGYTNSGTVSILPYIPVASNNPAFVVLSSALSGETHNLASRIGWNWWGQYYGWQW